MSDGITVVVPEERSDSGEQEIYNVSADEALDMAASMVNGVATERINGDEEKYDDADTRRFEKEKVMDELEDKVFDAWGY